MLLNQEYVRQYGFKVTLLKNLFMKFSKSAILSFIVSYKITFGQYHNTTIPEKKLDKLKICV